MTRGQKQLGDQLKIVLLIQDGIYKSLSSFSVIGAHKNKCGPTTAAALSTPAGCLTGKHDLRKMKASFLRRPEPDFFFYHFSLCMFVLVEHLVCYINSF